MKFMAEEVQIPTTVVSKEICEWMVSLWAIMGNVTTTFVSIPLIGHTN